MLLCQAVYWEYHSEQVRPIMEIRVFTHGVYIANPSKLASKIQDQIPELTGLYWASKSIFGEETGGGY